MAGDERKGPEQPKSIDLGRRDFAGTEFAESQEEQADARREAAGSADNRGIGDHDQEAAERAPRPGEESERGGGRTRRDSSR